MRQPHYWKWLDPYPALRTWCAGCGKEPAVRAHVHARGRGGPDWFNINWLDRQCHEASEKQPDAFIKKTGHDLWASARSLTVEHFTEMNYPEFCVAGPEGCAGDVEGYICERHGHYWVVEPRQFLDEFGRGFKPLEEELAA